VDFEIDIDPPSLVARIVSVRDQIADEWTADLATLIKANDMILDSYHAMQGAQREEEAANQGDSSKNKLKSTEEGKTVVPVALDDVDDDEDDDDEEEENDDDEDECVKYGDGTDDCVDGDSLAVPYSGNAYEETSKDKSLKPKAYDRTPMLILGNNIVQDGRPSSPYRKGSFDLLGLLATQESIHRVLRKYKHSGDERDVSYQWLRQFYVSRVTTFFDGSQEYGRADDFLEELLLTAPSMREMDGKLGLIDPMRIAEDIIATRTEVAQEWRGIVTNVPTVDHAELRKYVLAIRMGKRFDTTPSLDEQQIFEEGFQ
jgi:hypothetical protein